MQPSGVRLCPKCDGEVRDHWKVCPVCAARIYRAGEETKTEFLGGCEGSSSSSIDEGRFPAGTVLAGRFRILGLIGKGGMGEVYRAQDMVLNQAVALKFLAGAQMNEASLARFRNEVRVARQVSHPNVCRVHDIGFIEGQHFLSMEYLDGEDLASLLRRIGRLPQDKAIEFARKICAGLSAAHERGVLHRDLKPANIMIDSRGQVRITDFGLAALAQEIALGDIRSGTPAYMSPEQKVGKEVTTRSDVYALGLVLYEMFTGKSRSASRTSPSELVKDLDPAVERVILRCLEEDPKRRPASALGVAMALPGGDPIAAALAAGETPSPEMVAASGEKEGFSARTAVLCFVVVALSLVGAAFSGKYGTVVSRTRLDLPPEALAYRAQETLKRLGYAEAPAKTAYGFDAWDPDYLTLLQRRDPRTYDAILSAGRPAIVGFWYRQHRGEFWLDSFLPAPQVGSDTITYDAPPNVEPGMIRLFLDPKGRLLQLEVRPTPAMANGRQAQDWAALFEAADLDPARFTPAVSSFVPPTASDALMAWTGTYADHPSDVLRVEAAWWRGNPVFFDIQGQWKRAETLHPASSGLTMTMSNVAKVILFLTFTSILFGSAAAARYNYGLGRGDGKGAAQIATVAFAAMMGVWALGAAHVSSYWELHLLVKAVSVAAFIAGFLWSLYFAIEPYVRRNWPDSLISWTRLQRGRVRDPLVASHLLLGTLVSCVFFSLRLAMGRLSAPVMPLPAMFTSLNDIPTFGANLLNLAIGGLILGQGFLLIVVLLRLLIRRVWIADVIAFLVFGLASVGPGNTTNPKSFALASVLSIASAVAMLWVLRRLGLLAVVTTTVLTMAMSVAPIALTSWYGGRSLVLLAIPAVLASWALWVILSAGRRPLAEQASY